MKCLILFFPWVRVCNAGKIPNKKFNSLYPLPHPKVRFHDKKNRPCSFKFIVFDQISTIFDVFASFPN